MKRSTITGNKALAKELGVSRSTVQKWKRRGVLDSAILSHFGHIVIYDLDIVYECLNHKPVNVGRRVTL